MLICFSCCLYILSLLFVIVYIKFASCENKLLLLYYDNNAISILCLGTLFDNCSIMLKYSHALRNTKGRKALVTLQKLGELVRICCISELLD